jgi:hypothetical protein
MIDFIFTDNNDNTITVRTNGVDQTTENLTISDVVGLNTAALQTLFGRRIDKGTVITRAALIAVASAVGFNLNIHNQGPATPVAYVTGVKNTLTAPATLTPSVISATQINLSWTAASGTKRNYVLDRATNVGFTTGVNSGIYSGPLTTFNNTGLTTATQYFYRVRVQGLNANDSVYATASATTS